MTSKTGRKDLNTRAASIVSQATGGSGHLNGTKKDPAAVALGRKGGLKGGKARADKLTSDQKSEIARIAAQARWKKSDR